MPCLMFPLWIGVASSMIISIIWGVFQGSILGPVCFIVFMNDIVFLEIDGCIIIIYADDTTVALKLTGNKLEDQRRLDEMMRRITIFMRANQCCLVKKWMILSLRQARLLFSMDRHLPGSF